ncbi:MAG TPA: L,D-transpeptidase [Thermoanaerobaculia bacterium]|jgi:lipoprotein-anchoring transpeptidase ErfK/SrfK|nr:L,D-transpeptidase [Thermoanaerobaculia bacterium]
MKRWIGYLASWAFLVLGLGLGAAAIAAEIINVREARQVRRFDIIDDLIGRKTVALRRTSAADGEAGVKMLADADQALTDFQDTDQTILVSTAENTVYVRRGGNVVFKAICSTGKGTTLVDGGRTMVFDTPSGKFRIVSKEENPVWVPPDWHYIEEARKNGLRIVHLSPGQSIDAASGAPAAPHRETGVWSLLGETPAQPPARSLRIKGDTVVEEINGVDRELPAGVMILAGNTIVIPPINVKQRHFANVLGSFRLNLGDGYALHGTQQTSQLGQSVSHGCVRIGDKDLETLYAMSNVGDEVIIY